jgi:hypothetical protein
VKDSVNIVLAAIQAVEDRDADALVSLYHDDIEFHDAPSLPYGGTTCGKATVVNHMYGSRGWPATWTPLQPTAKERAMDPRIVAAAGEDVVVLFHQRARNSRNVSLDCPVLALYKVRDAKLIRAQMFHFDTAAIVAFLAHGRSSDLAGQ